MIKSDVVMKEILIVGAGGFAGSILRYLVSKTMVSCVAVSGFPFATLTVNVIGSLLIGGLVSAGTNGGWYLLAVTGFCGGFTTFSTFSLECVGLFRSGNWSMGITYIAASLLLSIAAVIVGFYFGVKWNDFK